MNTLRGAIRGATLAAVALLVTACASTPTPSQPKGPDLSGDWVLTTESQMGAQDAQMTIRQTGNALVGTITGESGPVDYVGSVAGAAVTFDFSIPVQGTELKLNYVGAVEGDTMKGKAVFGQFGEGTFTARRK
jgi:hypothetical protein